MQNRNKLLTGLLTAGTLLGNLDCVISSDMNGSREEVSFIALPFLPAIIERKVIDKENGVINERQVISMRFGTTVPFFPKETWINIESYGQGNKFETLEKMSVSVQPPRAILVGEMYNENRKLSNRERYEITIEDGGIINTSGVREEYENGVLTNKKELEGLDGYDIMRTFELRINEYGR